MAARAAGELAPVSEKLAPQLALEQLVGAAPEFRAALAVAAKAARNRLPILIIGEPGTGKETVARAIHAASLRAKGPLLSLDCKAIAANIIDSELFGHEKGAFPGAFAPKVGKLVQADTGTLLLDEIGALPAATQETLDRVLATYDRDEGRLIVLPTFRGKQGNPMLWDRRFFPEILQIGGDSGARFLISRHMETVAEVEVGEDSVLRDFDTTDELATLPSRLRPELAEAGPS